MDAERFSCKWATEQVNKTKITHKQKQNLQDRIRTITAIKNGISSKDIIVQLRQGSLIIEAEKDTPGVEWPNATEVAQAIDEVLAGEPSMGDRIQGYTWSNEKEEKGLRLITEKTINLTKFFGEQDSKNQIPYMKWARQLKGFIGTKGEEGAKLVAAMNWAETKKRNEIINDDIAERNAPRDSVKQLELLIRNWTDGLADKTVTYNVKNGLDAWRELHNEQLPEAKHRPQLLMNEFHNLSKASTVAELKHWIREIERITALWSETTDEGVQFDEQVKMSKLRTIIPTGIFNHIAIQASECPDYDSLVSLIETQIMDPVTGLSRGEKMPGLNELGGRKGHRRATGTNWRRSRPRSRGTNHRHGTIQRKV